MNFDDLIAENTLILKRNDELQQELHKYKRSLWSVLNILEPEQRALIQHDLFETDYQLIDYA